MRKNACTDDDQLKAMLDDPATRRRGFDVMVRQYSEQIYWQVRRFVLNHEDADDIVQNAFLKAWNAIDTFHGESKVLTWLSRIAINEAIDFNRRQKKHIALRTDDDNLALANRLQADRYFDGDRAEAILQEAIARLPEAQKTVFLLRYYDEMKYSEISRITGTSEGGLKANYHIAVKKIVDFFHCHD